MNARSLSYIIVPAAWLLTLVAGWWRLEAYQAEAGPAGRTPLCWISDGEGETPPLPLLRMFVHPHCPCTRAALTELAAVLSQSHQRVTTEVVVVRPPEVAVGWERSELVRLAEKIPGVRVVCDAGGIQADRFGAKTSGYVVYYDQAGKPAFCGGITRSRGHPGDNPGRRDLISLLNGEMTASSPRPTFGCPLFTPAPCCEVSGAKTSVAEQLP